METISRNLLTFLLNSLWQIPLAAGVAWLVCRFLGNGPARHRHTVWVTALAAAVLLPLVSMGVHRGTTESQIVSMSPEQAMKAMAPVGLAHSANAARPATAPKPESARTVTIAAATALVLLGLYALLMLVRMAMLAAAILRTVRIRQRAYRAQPSEAVSRVWDRCLRALGLNHAELLFSAQLSGPVTAGRTIFLPESLALETSEDVLTTAIGHEMAHVARGDFRCNLLYEGLHLLVSYHPAAWMIRREIERTREMACDEVVAERLLDAGVYARSIVSIAAAMTALPQPGYTLGVFDGNILEDRVRRLIERPVANLKRARLALATGLLVLLVCGVAASMLAVSARAQSGAESAIKEGDAALTRGDFAGAIAQFESAVRMEPANLNAKLRLATAILRNTEPTEFHNPHSGPSLRVRQLYLDVLAHEPRNLPAIDGMVNITLVAKQFAETRQWLGKAIEADPGAAGAYYTIGFIDWAVTYPDYMKARVAAGMQLADPGIIPDVNQRLSIRLQHQADLAEGLQNLNVALQFKPDYDDAMAYINLLYRIKAALADTEEQYAEYTAQADAWVGKALEVKRRKMASAAAQGEKGMAQGTLIAPPPPPPPPPSQGNARAALAPRPDSLVVSWDTQRSLLLEFKAPAYPSLAQKAGVTGTVLMSLTVGKDGSVVKADYLSGPALLAEAALSAARQAKFRPTLLNGRPVEVVTTMTTTFRTGGQ